MLLWRDRVLANTYNSVRYEASTFTEIWDHGYLTSGAGTTAEKKYLEEKEILWKLIPGGSFFLLSEYFFQPL